MKIAQLKTEPRTRAGSAESRRHRRNGQVPVVIYGQGAEPYSALVDAKAFEHELNAGQRTFKLAIAGKEEAALLQDIQYDALGEYIVHLDFKRVDLTKKVRVKVALHFEGAPEMQAGAVVDHVTEDVEVECLPAEIPPSIEVLLTGMTVGTHIEAKELKLPAGLTLVTDPHKTLVSYHYKSIEPVADAAATETAQPEMTKEKKDGAAAEAKPAADKKDAKK